MWIRRKVWERNLRALKAGVEAAHVYDHHYSSMQQLAKFIMDSRPETRHLVLPENMTEGCACGQQHSTQERYDAIVRAICDNLNAINDRYFYDLVPRAEDDSE